MKYLNAIMIIIESLERATLAAFLVRSGNIEAAKKLIQQ